jgi:hypothetical protein
VAGKRNVTRTARGTLGTPHISGTLGTLGTPGTLGTLDTTCPRYILTAVLEATPTALPASDS